MRKKLPASPVNSPFLFSLAALLCCRAVVGCGRPKTDGTPKLFPCQAKALQDGSPPADATVPLHGPDGFKWAVSGTTDASGVAKMRAHWAHPGAPEGEFKATIINASSKRRKSTRTRRQASP